MKRLGAATRDALGLAALIAVSPAAAQEISLLAGTTRAGAAHSYAWLFSYSRDLGEHAAASFTWQNEGHLPDHRRDGYSAQIWAKTALFSPRLTLAAGVGPYRYFDTVAADAGGFDDEHGYGVLYSVSATWRTSGRLLYQARLNRSETRRSLDTTALVFGVGSTLDQDGAPMRADARASASGTGRDELTVLAGRTIVNSLVSEDALARDIEYRHAFGPVLRGTLAWIDEGDSGLVGRRGVAAQAWLEPSFAGERFTLGVGFGMYIAEDRRREGDDRAVASAIVTMTASARFGREWTGRVSWNRIASSYDRDTDVVLFGIGCRFSG